MNELKPEKIEKLLNQISLGSNKAIRELYMHYHSSLFAFIRFRVWDDAAAEEILDDTFMVVFRNPERYNRTSAFSTWLFGIAKNVCGTWIRRQQSAESSSTVELEEKHLETLAAPDCNMLEQMESDELSQILKNCMDRLPEQQREVLFWAWFEEESLESIAGRVESPLGTVKSRLFHARSRVADCVRKRTGMEADYV